jgi:hypothetical protein
MISTILYTLFALSALITLIVNIVDKRHKLDRQAARLIREGKDIHVALAIALGSKKYPAGLINALHRVRRRQEAK